MLSALLLRVLVFFFNVRVSWPAKFVVSLSTIVTTSPTRRALVSQNMFE